jgi:GT2 family glycosyltransferase
MSGVAGRLSVVIPHWNAKDLLAVCLPPLLAQTYPDLEIIVVDNASSDGSADFLRQNFPSVKLIELSRNQGFTGACNAGILASTGEFIALLNNDTEVAPHWATALVEGFARFPQAGFLASRMMLFDRRDHFHAVGDFYRVDGLPGNRGVWQKDEGQFEEAVEVFSACGGAAAYRRSLLEEIGLLDENFFFSCEDIDLAWRAQLRGYRCVYIPQALVYHMLSATGGGVTASYYVGRNLLYVLWKDYPRALWRKYGWAILRQQVGLAWSALRAWRGASARARLRGMMKGVLDAPKLLRQRRLIQGQRCVSIAYLESILTPISGDKGV